MSCYLRILGAFSPEDVIADSPVEWEISYRAGEKSRKGEGYVVSSIQVQISAANFNAEDAQFADAVAYLRKHIAYLRVFCKRPEFDEVVIDFGFNFPENCIAFWRRVPAMVTKLAALCNASIELSFYPVAHGGNTPQIKLPGELG